jgi:hypothetical protein
MQNMRFFFAHSFRVRPYSTKKCGYLHLQLTITQMPKISHKGAQMPSSPIRKLVPFAEKAKKDGKTIPFTI